MPSTPQPTDDAHNVLLTTFGWMLRRLVRLALTFGMPYPAFEALLKRSYLDSATEDFALEGKAQTDSRLTLLTGMNRSDLRRLRAAAKGSTPLPLSLEWRVAMRWLSAPYIDASGQPAPLSRSISTGGERSFEALVQALNTDIRANGLLEQWLQQQLVRADDDGQLHFDQTRFFNRLGRSTEQTAMLAAVVGDLVQGYIENMPGPAQRPLHVRSLWLDRLTEASAQTLCEAADRLVDASRALFIQGKALEAADKDKPDARYRFRYSAYRYRTSIDRDPPLQVDP
jgi:hypothetical protein